MNRDASAAMDIDWTGVAPPRFPIAPLDDHTFSFRLRLLVERADSLVRLRQAFTASQLTMCLGDTRATCDMKWPHGHSHAPRRSEG